MCPGQLRHLCHCWHWLWPVHGAWQGCMWPPEQVTMKPFAWPLCWILQLVAGVGRGGEAAAKLLPSWAGVGKAKHNPSRNISKSHLLFELPAAVSLLFPAGRGYYFLVRVPRQGRCMCPMREMQFVAEDLYEYILAGVLNMLSKTVFMIKLIQYSKINSGIQFRREGFYVCLSQVQTHIMSSAEW